MLAGLPPIRSKQVAFVCLLKAASIVVTTLSDVLGPESTAVPGFASGDHRVPWMAAESALLFALGWGERLRAGAVKGPTK